MRLQIFDPMDEMGWFGDIKIDESNGFPDVIITEYDDNWGLT